MIYTVYKTTCLENGKYYIGVHKTRNPTDAYLGSGFLMKRAIRKYGKNAFRKEVLFTFDTAEEAFSKEEELLAGCYHLSECYNVIEGGKKAAFKYLNNSGISVPLDEQRNRDVGFKTKSAKAANAAMRELWTAGGEWAERYSMNRSKAMKVYYETNDSVLKDLNKCPEFQEKRKEAFKKSGHQKGEKNSNFGTVWITDGFQSKKQNKNDPIPEGWRLGRVIKTGP